MCELFPVGSYIGYLNTAPHDQLMVWVPHLQPSALKVAEAKSKTPTELARALFVEIFKKELSERPDKVNCTETLDSKELLNQQFIREYVVSILRRFTRICIYYIPSGNHTPGSRWNSMVWQAHHSECCPRSFSHLADTWADSAPSFVQMQSINTQ